MLPHEFQYLFLAVLSGLSFALMGVALRLGYSRGVSPAVIILVCGLAGFVYFAGKIDWTLIRATPFPVWGWAAFAALGAYGCAKFVYHALRQGLLSPVWCSANLSFIPVIIYAAVVFNEGFPLAHQFALLCAVGCVVTASAGQRRKAPAPAQAGLPSSGKSASSKMNYGALLLLILFCNGTINLALKHLNTASLGDNVMIRHGNVFFLAFYGLTAGFIGMDLLFHQKNPPPLAWGLGLGLMAAIGSIGGQLAVSAASRVGSAIVFAISSMVSLIAVAVVSLIVRDEKPSSTWFSTVGLGVMAVVLVGLSHA